MNGYIWLIPIFPLLGVIINLFFGQRLGTKGAGVIANIAVGLSFFVSLLVFIQVTGGQTVNINYFDWIVTGDFKTSVGMQIDQLSAVMLLVVTFVSFLIHIYSTGYMHGDSGYIRYFIYLNLFVFSMIMLVMANNFLLMFVFWEAVGLCSYLLIGFWFEKKSAADAGKKAFIVNRVGDFGFALGLLLLFVSLGSLDFNYVFANANMLSTGLVTVITLLLFLGATGKSAQIPLYVWLPDAMEGPTPVSALIHAATMVTAGVYMVARCHVLYTLAPISQQVVATVGILTAIYAASIALVNTDIKRVLAYSTISQLGYMFVAVGVGAYTAGIFHLATHAFFKALLFLGAGSVIHALSGEQDIRKMGGLNKHLRITAPTFLIAVLAISGCPPFSGFFSKDEILASAFHSGHYFIWLLGLITAGMTAFYMFRLFFLTFTDESRVASEKAKHIHESPRGMTVPLIILAIFAAIAGLVGIPGKYGTLFGNFLGPVFGFEHEAHSIFIELALMAISVFAAGCGFLIAWKMYITKSLNPEKLASRMSGLYKLMLNKYYVDEVYDKILVNPTKRLAETLWRAFDDKVVDGTVNGVAGLVAWSGGLVRRIQTGYVSSYAMLFVLGIIVVFGYYLIR
ncbi:MAG: NADH-quinone oxidoreductase subunit L [bacterium]|nr:NADH-quinone oxidoreductase subunit L [bacterium]